MKRWTWSGSAAAVACASGALLAGIGEAGARSNGGRQHALIESAWCGAELPTTTTATVPSSGSGLQQVVTVHVPATALIRVDSGRHVVAALTNTGCAPSPADDVYIVHADGSIEPARHTEFTNRRWIGDFTVAGVYVSQTRSPHS